MPPSLASGLYTTHLNLSEGPLRSKRSLVNVKWSDGDEVLFVRRRPGYSRSNSASRSPSQSPPPAPRPGPRPNPSPGPSPSPGPNPNPNLSPSLNPQDGAGGNQSHRRPVSMPAQLTAYDDDNTIPRGQTTPRSWAGSRSGRRQERGHAHGHQHHSSPAPRLSPEVQQRPIGLMTPESAGEEEEEEEEEEEPAEVRPSRIDEARPNRHGLRLPLLLLPSPQPSNNNRNSTQQQHDGLASAPVPAARPGPRSAENHHHHPVASRTADREQGHRHGHRASDDDTARYSINAVVDYQPTNRPSRPNRSNPTSRRQPPRHGDRRSRHEGHIRFEVQELRRPDEHQSRSPDHRRGSESHRSEDDDGYDYYYDDYYGGGRGGRRRVRGPRNSRGHRGSADADADINVNVDANIILRDSDEADGYGYGYPRRRRRHNRDGFFLRGLRRCFLFTGWLFGSDGRRDEYDYDYDHSYDYDYNYDYVQESSRCRHVRRSGRAGRY
ncbi:hypothetical protein F5B17DRAFT_294243 [Nemania serpens]|nr:hypothetical protein F5B17DRAFT_294243 [Nemania serpens]